MELSFERWEGMQRQGQDIADRFTSLAQGIGCMLHSQIRSTSGCSSSQVEDPRPGSQSDIGLSSWSWPWPNSRSTGRHSQVERVGFDIHRKVLSSQNSRRAVVTENASGFYEIGQKLGQAGAELGACVSDFVGNVTKHFYKPGHGDGPVISAEPITNNLQAPATNIGIGGAALEWRDVEESPNEGVVWQAQNTRQRRSDEGPSNQDIVSDFHDASNEELLSFLSKAQGQFQKQSSITVTTTYDSRTQDIESNIIARGDLWRAEASHGSTSSGNGNSPLFLLQIGPILFVRDTTLLLPIHLSKQHLLWYGFDRKNGVHSLCPAVWSKHRRWLLMSMICLNPLTCSFMDLQFPNGQLTYVAGEGLTGSAFLPALGGLLQAQGRLPGESKLSFSCKNKWGTRINPSLQLPEKSLSLCLTQPLAWQRSGLMLRPTIQLSVTPTFGGRNAGWKAEFVHSPKEKLSWACGCALTIEPSAFASVSIGRSKRNGENIGSSGIVLQVESPLENFRRTTFSIQLNSGVEF